MVDDGGLIAVRTAGGQRLIDGESLAAVTKPKRKAGRDEPARQSARNRFPGIVTRVIKDRVAAQVEIQAGPHRLGSLLAREAAGDPGLKPRMPPAAVAKAPNFSGEVARGRDA